MPLGDLLLAKMELALVPSKVIYKDVLSGASLKQVALGSKASESIPPILKRKPEAKTSAKGIGDKPTEAVAPQQEVPREEPIDTSPVQGIWYPDMPSHPGSHQQNHRDRYPSALKRGTKATIPSLLIPPIDFYRGWM
ncbi:hypothetical protein LIER_33705 [Lithospermum erythrorhizon]|uniref:Uncharacterized protein n=1 Tax=Lithospermum erythrorhizon TaxID=34254 RepID=A0AAV3S1I8_LITER